VTLKIRPYVDVTTLYQLNVFIEWNYTAPARKERDNRGQHFAGRNEPAYQASVELGAS